MAIPKQFLTGQHKAMAAGTPGVTGMKRGGTVQPAGKAGKVGAMTNIRAGVGGKVGTKSRPGAATKRK